MGSRRRCSSVNFNRRVFRVKRKEYKRACLKISEYDVGLVLPSTGREARLPLRNLSIFECLEWYEEEF